MQRECTAVKTHCVKKMKNKYRTMWERKKEMLMKVISNHRGAPIENLRREVGVARVSMMNMIRAV